MMEPNINEKMRVYSALAEKTIASQKVRCIELQDEVELCRRLIQSLQSNLSEAQERIILQENVKRVSQFNLERLESGGTREVKLKEQAPKGLVCTVISECDGRGGCCQVLSGVDMNEIVRTKCHLERGENVLRHHTKGVETVYEVVLNNADPCPSPDFVQTAGKCKIEVDIAQTMCDVWARATEVEAKYKKAARRQAMKRNTNVKVSVCRAFGCCDILPDSTLFRAACGFVVGSQEQYHQDEDDDSRGVGTYLKLLGNNDVSEKATRCTEKDRKEMLTQMVTFMYNGEVAQELEMKVLRKKRFSTVKLARVSDMNSSFNPSALGAIASCEGGKGHGEMGLLCGESTLRRCLNQVHKQAVELGFYSLPEKDDGNVWCWGDDRAAFTTAVNLYVKTIYCDACCDSVTATDPWIVPLTGDAARTSQRGTIVTVLGPKMADRRLVNQQRSMKTMYQGSDMYTPACAGYATEDELMEYFHLLVAEFRKIEAQQYCVVNGTEYTVYIKVVVIADLSFLHKYVRRGGGSHSATCFCLFCGALRNFRHHGYPGGCRKCRALGEVYDKDGLQICRHYESCTPEFLEWQSHRYAELALQVPNFPLTSLPAWEDVAQLRSECLKRCVGRWAGWRSKIEKTGKGKMTEQDLSEWIQKYTRDDATLSNSTDTGVMHCPIKVVKASLAARNIKVSVRGNGNGEHLRLQLRARLQLEQEYTRMTMHMRDTRFTSSHISSKAIPLDRLILCVLHCPMRTHEKVLTLLLQQACEQRTPSKCYPILDVMVAIIRRLGKLKDTWTYVWEKGAKCVSKIKMHWDQSKRIFKEENLMDLEELIRSAIRPADQAHWISFIVQYIKLIDLMTVTRDYSDGDIDQLEIYCNETYRLLVDYCGGKAAVTNYFHYIGSGHIVWMCRAFGNIWRYRNEGVEAWNKNLSKRSNMFNSHGNRGNQLGVGTVEPFEVLGKWMGRYAMWQLEFANQLFITNGGTLGPSEVIYDAHQQIWEYVSDNDAEDDDDDYSITSVTSSTEGESDLEDYQPEDASQCVYNANEDEVRRYSMRKRPL